MYLNFEICHTEINKTLNNALKYGKMIDERDLVQGREKLHHVQCKSCRKIPISLDIRKCKSCQSIICNNCYSIAYTEMEDS